MTAVTTTTVITIITISIRIVEVSAAVRSLGFSITSRSSLISSLADVQEYSE